MGLKWKSLWSQEFMVETRCSMLSSSTMDESLVMEEFREQLKAQQKKNVKEMATL